MIPAGDTGGTKTPLALCEIHDRRFQRLETPRSVWDFSESCTAASSGISHLNLANHLVATTAAIPHFTADKLVPLHQGGPSTLPARLAAVPGAVIANLPFDSAFRLANALVVLHISIACPMLIVGKWERSASLGPDRV